MTEPMPKTAVNERVYEPLREALIRGNLEPGEAITVRGLAARYQVSAMPAREAINRLVAIGALEQNDTRRIRVPRVSAQTSNEIKLARLALEPVLAKEALIKMTASARKKAQWVKTLRACDEALDDAISSGDARAYARLNSEFHFSIYRASRAKVLLGLVESLWLQVGPHMRVIIGRLGTQALQDDKHKLAIKAIENDRPDDLAHAIRMDVSDGMDLLCEHTSKAPPQSTR